MVLNGFKRGVLGPTSQKKLVLVGVLRFVSTARFNFGALCTSEN